MESRALLVAVLAALPRGFAGPVSEFSAWSPEQEAAHQALVAANEAWYAAEVASLPAWHKRGDPSKDCAWVAAHAPRCDARGEDGTMAYLRCPDAGCAVPQGSQGVLEVTNFFDFAGHTQTRVPGEFDTTSCLDFRGDQALIPGNMCLGPAYGPTMNNTVFNAYTWDEAQGKFVLGENMPMGLTPGLMMYIVFNGCYVLNEGTEDEVEVAQTQYYLHPSPDYAEAGGSCWEGGVPGGTLGQPIWRNYVPHGECGTPLFNSFRLGEGFSDPPTFEKAAFNSAVGFKSILGQHNPNHARCATFKTTGPTQFSVTGMSNAADDGAKSSPTAYLSGVKRIFNLDDPDFVFPRARLPGV